MQKVLMLGSFIKTIWSKLWLVLIIQPLCSLLPVCSITVLPFDQRQQVSQYLCHYLPTTAHTILPQSIITQTETCVVFLPLWRSKGDDRVDLFSSCIKKNPLEFMILQVYRGNGLFLSLKTLLMTAQSSFLSQSTRFCKCLVDISSRVHTQPPDVS